MFENLGTLGEGSYGVVCFVVKVLPTSTPPSLIHLSEPPPPAAL